MNEYPISKATDQLLYAVYLVLNGRSEGFRVLPNGGGQYMTEDEELKILDHVTDIKQIDWLVRLYVMLAEMEQQNWQKYKQYVLAATTLAHRVWKVSWWLFIFYLKYRITLIKHPFF